MSPYIDISAMAQCLTTAPSAATRQSFAFASNFCSSVRSWSVAHLRECAGLMPHFAARTRTGATHALVGPTRAVRPSARCQRGAVRLFAPRIWFVWWGEQRLWRQPRAVPTHPRPATAAAGQTSTSKNAWRADLLRANDRHVGNAPPNQAARMARAMVGDHRMNCTLRAQATSNERSCKAREAAAD